MKWMKERKKKRKMKWERGGGEKNVCQWFQTLKNQRCCNLTIMVLYSTLYRIFVTMHVNKKKYELVERFWEETKR